MADSVWMAMVASESGANNKAIGFSEICRTCAARTDNLTPIFSGEGLLNNLADKIRHLPIKVSERDLMPKQMCGQCASTLVAYHEMVKISIMADAAMRKRLQRLDQLRDEEPDRSPQYRCPHCDACFTHRDICRDHVAYVHIDIVFLCQECNEFEHRDNLIPHMARHVRERNERDNSSAEATTPSPAKEKN